MGQDCATLAIHGGSPAIEEGPPAWPPADDDVAEALARAAADGSWGRYDGPHNAALAERLTAMHNGRYVRLCSSGTIAVELALRGGGVQQGDEVMLAAYDFPGNFRAIEAIGARPVLVDIDPNSWCLDPANVTAAHRPAIRAVIASHLHGHLAPMRRLREMADRQGWFLVEDACQAPGAVVDGQTAGTWGDAGVLSFGGSKLLTAGRGGAVLSRAARTHQRIKVFAGRGNDAFPLSELQAAVLAPQLDRLDVRNQCRRKNVQRLLAAIRQVACLVTPVDPAPDQPSYYKLSWLRATSRIDPPQREALIAAFRAEGVAIDAGFRGFAGRSPRRCRRAGPLPYSRRAADDTLLLHHPVLLQSPATIDRLAAAFLKVDRYFRA